MSQKPLLTYTLPSTIFAPVWVGVSGPVMRRERARVLVLRRDSTFSKPELGYRYSRYRLEYSVVSWSRRRALDLDLAEHAVPGVLRPVLDPLEGRAGRDLAGAGSFFAWSTLMSEVAMRRVTRAVLARRRSGE